MNTVGSLPLAKNALHSPTSIYIIYRNGKMFPVAQKGWLAPARQLLPVAIFGPAPPSIREVLACTSGACARGEGEGLFWVRGTISAWRGPYFGRLQNSPMRSPVPNLVTSGGALSLSMEVVVGMTSWDFGWVGVFLLVCSQH